MVKRKIIDFKHRFISVNGKKYFILNTNDGNNEVWFGKECIGSIKTNLASEEEYTDKEAEDILEKFLKSC